MKISFPSYGYHMLYLGKFYIDNKSNSVTIEHLKTINLGNDIFIPIDQAGLTGSIFDVEKLRDSLKEIKNKIENGLPILFIYDNEYANQYNNIKVKFLAGITFNEETNREKSSHQFILGYTSSNNTECTYRYQGRKTGDKCRLFFIIFTDKEFIEKIKAIRNINIIIKNKNNVTVVQGKEFKLIYSKSRDVKVYLRTFPIISGNESYLSNDNTISYFPINVENIYLGSQLYAKEYYVREFKNNLPKEKKQYYFVYPLLVLYTIFHKNKDDSTNNYMQLEPILLPKERIFESFALKISFNDLTWGHVEKLVDWLFNKHPESLLKILLTNDLLDRINGYLQDEGIIAANTRIPPLEIVIQTKVGGLNLQYGSYILQRIMKIYYNMEKINDFKSFLIYFLELIYKIKKESNIIINSDKINENILRNIKRMIGIFALMYGLHGISHLIMKVLEIKTKVSEYGERVMVNINSLEPIIPNYFSSSQGLISENVFEIRSEQLENPLEGSVVVFSKVPYSYSYFTDILVNKENNSVKTDIIREELKKILELNGKDSCEVKHTYEKDVLLPTLNMLRSYEKDIIQKLEGKILDFKNNNISPPRTLFRFLYEKYIIPNLKIKDLIKNKQYRIKLNWYAQFVVHYHIPSCVDGCYNCVLTARNISSTMCDLPPVQQELKTSKWAALCLLKHIGIIDYNWVDCDL